MKVQVDRLAGLRHVWTVITAGLLAALALQAAAQPTSGSLQGNKPRKKAVKKGKAVAVKPLPTPLSELQLLAEKCKNFEEHKRLHLSGDESPTTAAEEKAFLDQFVALLAGLPGDPVFVNGRLRPEAAAIFEKYSEASPGEAFPTWQVRLYRRALADNQDNISDSIEMLPRQVKEYGAWLAGLDTKDPESVSRAIAYARDHYAGRPPFLRDAAYFQFNDFWERVRVEQTRQLRRKYRELIEELNPPGWTQDLEARLKSIAAAPAYARNGFRLGRDEEGVLMEAIPDFFVDQFGGFVSEPLFDYLVLERAELAHPAFFEIYLDISPDELAARFRQHAEYVKRHPRSVYAATVAKRHDVYLADYLGRLSYSPIWDGDGSLEPGFRKSYEAFVQKYPATADGRRVAEFHAILKRHGFKWSPELARELKAARFEVAPPRGHRVD